MADIRERLSTLPAQVAIGQPISHRLDHLLSGVRTQIAVTIFGGDTDTLRGLAANMRAQIAGVPGLVDFTVEKQVLIPQTPCAWATARRRSWAWHRGRQSVCCKP